MYVTKVDTAMKSDFLLYILRKELILVSSHLWQENCGSAHAYSSIWYIQRKTYFKFSWVLKNSGTKSLMLKSSNLFPILPKPVYKLTHCFIWHNVAKKKSHKIIILNILENKPCQNGIRNLWKNLRYYYETDYDAKNKPSYLELSFLLFPQRKSKKLSKYATFIKSFIGHTIFY